MSTPDDMRNGAGQKALEQQGEISRSLGRLEGQLSQLQQSIDNMRDRMDREHQDMGSRVDGLERRVRGQDQKLLGAVCAGVTAAGASGWEHLVRILSAVL